MVMQTAFFDYELPARLIAQQPSPERDQSRLLVVRRSPATLAHPRFADLPDLLWPGDVLVLNDTRVLSARLLGRRARTGGRWEGLFLRHRPDGTWEMLCKTRGRLAEAETIHIEPGPLQLTLVQKITDGHWLVRPRSSAAAEIPAEPAEVLERFGQVPLPPLS
jgi:S-adenosylmethionine:tRNA ribosyltransferase-isomerase